MAITTLSRFVYWSVTALLTVPWLCSARAAEGGASGAMEDVDEAARVIAQLEAQAPELAKRVGHAKGVFIIPDYVTGSLVIGGSGGEGVLMARKGGTWGEPGFYDIGNVDVGVQAGGAAGSLVMVLESEKALERFEHSDTRFDLGTKAGLTLVSWSAAVPDTHGHGDAIVWSDTEGLLAELSVGIGGIGWDEEEARAYYDRDVEPLQVIEGRVRNPRSSTLRDALAQLAEHPATTQ